MICSSRSRSRIACKMSWRIQAQNSLSCESRKEFIMVLISSLQQQNPPPGHTSSLGKPFRCEASHPFMASRANPSHASMKQPRRFPWHAQTLCCGEFSCRYSGFASSAFSRRAAPHRDQASSEKSISAQRSTTRPARSRQNPIPVKATDFPVGRAPRNSPV